MLVFLLAISTSNAQEITPEKESEEKKFNFAVGINTDQFFGLYTTFQGSYGAPKKQPLPFTEYIGLVDQDEIGETGLSSEWDLILMLPKD